MDLKIKCVNSSTNSDGSMYGINVWKTTSKGAPIKREVEAIYDLEDVGIPMYFVGYDKWGEK
mgnify:CR=1 FL=1